MDMRSPQDGIVHQLRCTRSAGVITPGEPAMLIVPDDDELAVEVRIPPQDIDSSISGRSAHLRFAAFNQRTTPEIEGNVSRVSADVTTDPKSGASYYTARISVPGGQKERLGGVRLVPGMPVESLPADRRPLRSVLPDKAADRPDRQSVAGAVS